MIKAEGPRWIRLEANLGKGVIHIKWGCVNWYAIKDDLKAKFLPMYKGDLKMWEASFSQLSSLTEWAYAAFGSENVTVVGVPYGEQKQAPPPPPPRGRGSPAQESYSILYLLPDAPVEVIKAAYKAMARLHHPDAGGNDAAMKRVNNAYDKIMALRGA